MLRAGRRCATSCSTRQPRGSLDRLDGGKAGAPFRERLAAARKALETAGTPTSIARVLDHSQCAGGLAGVAVVKAALARVLALDPPGEGVMLSDADATHGGSSRTNMLKV
mmetsp:Transcript_20226/g.50626  ORF Transcript_20226/g.50626 Transcript_20226/m.50626 type:complete len:110 (+) Transcript_20226:400-729(+)